MKKGWKNKDASAGEIMIESMLVIIVTIFVLLVLVGLGFRLLQQWNVNAVAEDTAAKIAQTLKLGYSDQVMGYTSTEDLEKIDKYRYFLSASVQDTTSINETKGEEYARYRLGLTSLVISPFAKTPEVKVEIVSDGVVRRHVEVTITGEYEVLFSDLLDKTPLQPTRVYSAHGYAEAPDLLDYVTTTDFLAYQASLGPLDSTIVSIIDTILGLTKK
jgi:hypothetical protein